MVHEQSVHAYIAPHHRGRHRADRLVHLRLILRRRRTAASHAGHTIDPAHWHLSFITRTELAPITSDRPLSIAVAHPFAADTDRIIELPRNTRTLVASPCVSSRTG